MVLSALVILIWQFFFAPPIEPLPEDQEEVVALQNEGADDTPTNVAGNDTANDTPAAGAERDIADLNGDTPADAEAAVPPAPPIERRTDQIITPDLTLTLDNQGAVVKNAVITAPKQYAGVGGRLMRAFNDDAPAWPFELSFVDQNVELAGDELYEFVEDESVLTNDGESYSTITYRYTDPRQRFLVDKVYSVDPDKRYVVRLDISVQNLLDNVRLVDAAALDIIGRDDPDKERPWFDFRPDVLEAVCQTTDGTEREILENLEGSVTHSQFGTLWTGADTRYFLMGAAAENGANSCMYEPVDGDYLRTRLTHERFSIEPGQTWEAGHLLFIGPKDFDVLRDAGHRFEEAVDYGFFTVLARPLRRALVWFHGFTGNWGLAIILLTLVIKAATWRITGKAYVNAERMKLIQPQIKEIREKYEKDQQRMTEETMKVFKENKVSPLGCLPLVLQMPILYGLFIMIYNSVELYQAEFLWYQDLSAPDPLFMLPIIMGIVMFFQQRLTMQTSAATTNPQMMIVMKIMPFMFTAFMLFLPAGLVLYYLLNLLIGLAQQLLIKRRFANAEEAGEPL